MAEQPRYTLYVETHQGVEVVCRLFTSVAEANKYAVHRLSGAYPTVHLTGDPDTDLTALTLWWERVEDYDLMWFTTEDLTPYETALDAENYDAGFPWL